MKPSEYRSGNRLLDALPHPDRAQNEADLQFVALTAHQSTHSAGRAMEHVDFPVDAVLSVVATLTNGESVEVGTVGNESFVETDAALNSSVSMRTSFCQVQGTVARMSIARFEDRMETSVPFARLMRRSVRAGLFSAQQFAACNAKHAIVKRCARWLSMTQDRVGSSEFILTQGFLAIMLGVRRSGVSEASEALQKIGAITYRRGVVRVLDRALLNAKACECYAACKDAFAASLQE